MRVDFGDPLTDTYYALCVYDASFNPQSTRSALAPEGSLQAYRHAPLA